MRASEVLELICKIVSMQGIRIDQAMCSLNVIDNG